MDQPHLVAKVQGDLLFIAGGKRLVSDPLVVGWGSD